MIYLYIVGWLGVMLFVGFVVEPALRRRDNRAAWNMFRDVAVSDLKDQDQDG